MIYIIGVILLTYFSLLLITLAIWLAKKFLQGYGLEQYGARGWRLVKPKDITPDDRYMLILGIIIVIMFAYFFGHEAIIYLF